MTSPLPTDEDRKALARIVHHFRLADSVLAWMEDEGFRRSVVSTPSDEERDAREFLAKHYSPAVGWTVEELHLTVLVPRSLPTAGNGESLRLVREILDEAAFDIKVVERSAVSVPPTLTDAAVQHVRETVFAQSQRERSTGACGSGLYYPSIEAATTILRAALGGEEKTQ